MSGPSANPVNYSEYISVVVIEKEIEIHKSCANYLHISPFCLQRMQILPIKWSVLLLFNKTTGKQRFQNTP